MNAGRSTVCTCPPSRSRLPHRAGCPRYSDDRAWSIADRGQWATRSPVLLLTAREAAALDRLMDAYLGCDDPTDPGIGDLRAVRAKLSRLPQDHALYAAASGTSS